MNRKKPALHSGGVKQPLCFGELAKGRNDNFKRTTLLLTRDESNWLDEFIEQMRTQTGVKYSRSEAVGTAIEIMRRHWILERQNKGLPG